MKGGEEQDGGERLADWPAEGLTGEPDAREHS